MIVLVIIVFVLLGVSDFPPLIQKKQWYEVTVLSFLYLSVFTIASLQVFEIQIPSPIKGIQTLIVDVLKIGYEK